ncbi:amphi-Trp domain-containing protein [Natrarchaeobaculum sulfurireducens]|uniref:Uncharacterized protein n=1 Tax=Natrarchaeobaculum sulfurireducens TaxID=2044521 RepID=A0A346PUJ0_9EURY|nr:DUF1508 domain-containing protein [Natrarchaeobaculum sulfurireducens]AXR83185.1 hypothetical protein AArcMg_3200 [Natrarchaeobaculum sulfurireducens]
MGDSPTDFRLEWGTDREALAGLFRDVAVALERGGPIAFSDDETSVTLEVPMHIAAGLRVDHQADNPPQTGLTFDLQWDDDGSSVDRGTAVDETASTDTGDGPVIEPQAGTGGSTDTTPPTEAGSAAAPADAVVSARKRRMQQAEDSGNPARRSRFEVYEDRAGEWRWRLVHWNGNVVADGGEGYASKYNVKRAVKSVMQTASSARLVERSNEE